MLEVKQYRKVKQVSMVEYPVNKLGGKDDHFSSLQFEVIYFHYYVVFTISISIYYTSFIAIFRGFPACEFPFSQSLWAYEKKNMINTYEQSHQHIISLICLYSYIIYGIWRVCVCMYSRCSRRGDNKVSSRMMS